jgi:transcriptional regulator with XRE-family HTH domain
MWAHTFAGAARELRKHMGKSQQSMAGFLGISMASLRNYEGGSTAVPEARAAVAYMLLADASRRPDLVEFFRSVMYHGLGLEKPETRKQWLEALSI